MEHALNFQVSQVPVESQSCMKDPEDNVPRRRSEEAEN